jgi:hypothetical protein
MRRYKASHTTAGVQGLFYVLTGAWPIVHMESLLAVTGPKSDLWLVQTFGALLCGLGAVLVSAAISRQLEGGTMHAALVTAAVLAAADIVFVSIGAIVPVYLLDASVELVLVGCWTRILFMGRHAQHGVATEERRPSPYRRRRQYIIRS